MSSRTANTAAKIPAPSSGPRQLIAMRSPDLLSNMVEQLPLIFAVRHNRLWRQPIRSIPNAIELPEAASQFRGNFCPRLGRCLRTPQPPARKLLEVFAIRAIAANRQPFPLRQSGQQAQVRCAQREAQFAFPLQPACQGEPFLLGTLSRHRIVAEIRKRLYCHRNAKLDRLATVPPPIEHYSCRYRQNRDQRQPESKVSQLPGAGLFVPGREIETARPQFAKKIPQRNQRALDGVSHLGELLVEPRGRARVLGVMPAVNCTL